MTLEIKNRQTGEVLHTIEHIKRYRAEKALHILETDGQEKEEGRALDPSP